MTKEGEWTDKKEGTDFTVDRKNGTVTFTTAPGASSVTGYDNVEITAAKTRKGYAEKINKCKIISLFGVNGAMDRMFLSGNAGAGRQRDCRLQHHQRQACGAQE